MNVPLWLDNLAAYSFQIAILVAAATLLQHLLRIRMPALLLRGWQVLLMACILLPVLQPWKVTFTRPAEAVTAPLAVITMLADQTATGSFPLSNSGTIALILVAGVACRLVWLGVGLLRLSAYRRRSPLPARLPAAVQEMQMLVGVRPEIYISTEISGPVTFGLGRGAILFPASFLEMGENLQRPIACHELLHVRRHDWLFVVLEEVVRSLFWFHPAIWWAVARIQLYREQMVDREVLAITGERKPYLESLLHIAGMRNRAAAVPAPLFLKERHLAQRVTLMLTEVAMSKTRVIAAVSAVVVLLLCTARLTTAWFPLNAPGIARTIPQREARPVAPPKRDPIRVGGNVQESKLLVSVEPVYPEQARKARVSGAVILQVLVNEAGEVYEIKVLRGHPLLDDAAVDAVRQWRYSPTLLNGEPVPVIATVTVLFHSTRLSVTLDQDGNLRDPVSQLEGPALIQTMKLSPLGVTINPSANASMLVIEETARLLQKEGIADLQVAGFVARDGRLFATHVMSANGGNIVAPPSIALDNDRLVAIAKSSGLVDMLPPRRRPLLYRMFMNEVGEIVGVEQVRGPHIPAVESELMRTRVISPGRRGAEPVPVVFFVEVVVP